MLETHDKQLAPSQKLALTQTNLEDDDNKSGFNGDDEEAGSNKDSEELESSNTLDRRAFRVIIVLSRANALTKIRPYH